MEKIKEVRKYQKKPIIIEAVQWIGKNLPELVIFGLTGAYMLSDNRLQISTLEGGHIASVGDWIIKGIKGEFYPCKPDIFDLTYQLSEPKPDESRLLTKEEIRAISDEIYKQYNSGNYLDINREEIAKAQLAKATLFYEAEIKKLKEDHQIELQMQDEDLNNRYQARVGRIFKEIEEAVFGIPNTLTKQSQMDWQALKEQKGGLK